MLSLNIIQNLTWENISLIDEETLLSEEFLQKLDQLVEDPIFDLEPGRARDFFESVQSVLESNANVLNRNSEKEKQIHLVVLKLFWKAFPALDVRFKKNIFGDNLIASLSIGIQVLDRIKKYLRTYEFGLGPSKEERRNLSYSLETNQESLGDENLLTLSGEKLKPVVKNWLVLYNNFAPLSKQKRGNFEHINFINKDQNVSKLNEEQKEILTQIIEIYDWILFPPLGPTVIKDTSIQTARVKVPGMVQVQTMKLPDSLKPKTFTQNSEVLRPSLGPEIPKVKPVNLAEVMKNKDKIDLGGGSGIRFGGQESNQPISQSANQKNLQGEQKPKAQVDIEKKLEDLKKRKGNKLT